MCRTTYHAVIVFFSHTEVRKAISCNGLKIRLFHIISKYQLKEPIYILPFEAFAAVFFNVSFLWKQKTDSCKLWKQVRDALSSENRIWNVRSIP